MDYLFMNGTLLKHSSDTCLGLEYHREYQFHYGRNARFLYGFLFIAFATMYSITLNVWPCSLHTKVCLSVCLCVESLAVVTSDHGAGFHFGGLNLSITYTERVNLSLIWVRS